MKISKNQYKPKKILLENNVNDFEFEEETKAKYLALFFKTFTVASLVIIVRGFYA